MVWAVGFPSEFGEFFPRGDFRGHEDALAAHYGAEKRPGATKHEPPLFVFGDNRPLDGDGKPYPYFQDYIYDVTEKFHAEIGVRRPHNPPLLQVQPHEWPPEYVYERAYKRPVAMFKGPDRMYAVVEPLREIIERLEPGVHDFHPIRVFLPKDAPHPERFHMMVVGRWLDSFRPQESDPKSLIHRDGASPEVVAPYAQTYRRTAMSLTEFCHAHIWCERRLRPATFYISDRLKQAATAAGLRLPPHYRMREV